MSPLVRRRLVAAALAGVVVVAGLAVHRGASSTASDIAGDALYAAMAYLVVVVLAPRWPVWPVAAVAAGWCIAVELLQLTGLPAAWGAAFPPVRLVLGTGFDGRDILVYVMAVGVCAATDAVIRLVAGRAR